MRRYLYIIALFVFVIVSCTPDEIGTPFVEGQEVTITASMANSTSNAKQMPGKQRVSGKDAGATIDLTWNAGDQILVSVGDKSAVFTLSSGENTSAGEFTGKMPADGSEYSVSYPVDYSDDVLTHQTYVENGFGNGLMKMSTKQNGMLEDGFVLSADNAVLGLQLTGSQTLGEIVLTNIATTKTYTLHCDGVVLTAEAILFYIVVPVKDWANGMRVEVYDNDGDIILMKEKAGEIMFSATDAMVMPTLQTRERGKRIGIFSVGEGKYVSFSQGNLQYIQSTKTWQFAKEQYAYMGEKHYRNGQLVADTIEYFGWSGKNSKTPWGISLSTESSDYAGEFLDWGINTIAGDAPNTWRTFSNDEWLYICQGRKNADQLLGLGTIGTVTGLIILPDDWQLPAGLSFTPNTDNATKNQYTYNQWAELENAGAVFIATSGYFNPKLGGMRHIGEEGHIRTNALSDKGLQIYTVVKTDKIIYSYSGTQEQNLQYAFAQRLVHDTIVPRTIPKRIGVFSVAADKQVSFSQGNLQYIQSTDTWQFAREQYEYIGEDCLYDDQMADTIDLMGWSTDNPLSPWGLIFVQRNNCYYGSFVDWGVNTISNDLPNTWRTLTSDEWTYLLKTRSTSNMRYTFGNINGTKGVFLFPDDWCGVDEIPITASTQYQANPISLLQWELLESSGVVFLPSSGVYMGKTYNHPTAGLYWSSTADPSDEGIACSIYIKPSGIENWFSNRSTNRSVRLVHDTIVPEAIDLGLSVKWAHCYPNDIRVNGHRKGATE